MEVVAGSGVVTSAGRVVGRSTMFVLFSDVLAAGSTLGAGDEEVIGTEGDEVLDEATGGGGAPIAAKTASTSACDITSSSDASEVSGIGGGINVVGSIDGGKAETSLPSDRFEML